MRLHRRQFFREHAHAFEQRVGALGFFLVDNTDGKSHVHHDVIALIYFGDKIQARLTDNAAELNAASANAILFFNPGDFTRDSQAHLGSPLPRA